MKLYPRKFAWWLIIIVNIIPLMIWIYMTPIKDAFSGFWPIMTSVGRISGLLGYSLMATVIIIAARLRFLEKIFNGLNQIYIKHHLLGAISFILLLIHPLVLSVRYLAISSQSAALFLLPSSDLWAQTLGTISLIIMMALLVITFYLGWLYHIWKFSHRFLALAFLIAFFHVAFITSDVSQNILLRSYILMLGGLAIVAYGYKLLIEFSHIGKYDYVISNIIQKNSDVLEISLKPLGEPIKYFPGQFAFLSINGERISGEDHPFSFVSIPEESEIKFAIKKLGDYTNNLSNVKISEKAKIEGPYGTFGFGAKTNKPEIWIAGGIGITPFISLAKDLKNSGRQADLFLSFQSGKDIIYLEELDALVKENPRLRIFSHYSSVAGRLSANKVEEITGTELADRQIYICGQVPMMQSLREQFIIKGANKNSIHTEEFGF